LGASTTCVQTGIVLDTNVMSELMRSPPCSMYSLACFKITNDNVLIEQTMAEVRSKFADLPPEELDALIDEAVTATRQASVPKAG
jgi:hypothetical protein